MTTLKIHSKKNMYFFKDVVSFGLEMLRFLWDTKHICFRLSIFPRNSLQNVDASISHLQLQ